jgi:hypothetical protein
MLAEVCPDVVLRVCSCASTRLPAAAGAFRIERRVAAREPESGSPCRDKDMPNAVQTYHKVMLSIFTAIDDADIADQFGFAYEIGAAVYKKDIAQRDAEAAKMAATRGGGSRPRPPPPTHR